MFKKASVQDSIQSWSQVKSSVARGIRSSISDTYSSLNNEFKYINEDEEEINITALSLLIPKKVPVILAKVPEKTNIVVVNEIPLFFQKDPKSQWVPSLRTLHKYPDILPWVQVDSGAVKHIMDGANVMAPGLLSYGASLPQYSIPEGTIVQVKASEKENALAVGRLNMSTDDIKSIKKGIAVEVYHHLNDGLWGCPTLKR